MSLTMYDYMKHVLEKYNVKSYIYKHVRMRSRTRLSQSADKSLDVAQGYIKDEVTECLKSKIGLSDCGGDRNAWPDGVSVYPIRETIDIASLALGMSSSDGLMVASSAIYDLLLYDVLQDLGFEDEVNHAKALRIAADASLRSSELESKRLLDYANKAVEAMRLCEELGYKVEFRNEVSRGWYASDRTDTVCLSKDDPFDAVLELHRYILNLPTN